MKKVLLVSVLGLFLFSCGSKSACDCLKETKRLAKETLAAKGDVAKLAELAEEGAENLEACKDYKDEDYKDCK